MTPRPTPEARRPSRGDEARLDTIINHVADGIVIVDGAGLIRFVNPAAEALLGRAADELLDQPFGLPLVSDRPVEVDVLRGGNSPLLAELRVTQLEWEGAPAFLASMRDITDRQREAERSRELALESVARARAEADERRARFLAEASRALDSTLEVDRLLESLARLVITPAEELDVESPSPGGYPQMADLCIIDLLERDGNVRRVAVAHHDPSKRDLALSLRDRFPPSHDRPYLGESVFRTGEPLFHPKVTDEVIRDMTRSPEHADLVRRLGVRSVIVVPLRTRTELLGVMILGCEDQTYDEGDLAFAVEFSQRAALSITNARLYEAAQAASRAKSDFLAVMSHELRTPLNAIMGYTDLLLAHVAGAVNDSQREYLERICRGAEHLLGIVEEILSYTRVETGHDAARIEPVRVDSVVQTVAEIIRPLAEGKGLAFRHLCDSDLGELQTDPQKVRQILLNLLSNAVKFTEEGVVELSAERAVGGRTGCIFRVRDTGCGIPPEHLDRIFEPFWQVEQSARRKVGGTGLGLSVAKRLTELLGGELQVESRPGEGSVFSVFFPAKRTGTET